MKEGLAWLCRQDMEMLQEHLDRIEKAPDNTTALCAYADFIVALRTFVKANEDILSRLTEKDRT